MPATKKLIRLNLTNTVLSAILATSVLLTGCVVAVAKIYKTPATQGQLMAFNPNASQPFTPIVGAIIYYRTYPTKAVYSDPHGAFQLPATLVTEMKVLKVGHGVSYYPITIESDSFIDTVLARAPLNIRTEQMVDLGAILVMQSKPANSFSTAAFSQHASNWPCDQRLLQSLDQGVQTAQQLLLLFQQRPVISAQANIYAAQHYQRTQHLFEATQSSCKWPALSITEQHENWQQAMQYFAQADRYLNQLSLLVQY